MDNNYLIDLIYPDFQRDLKETEKQWVKKEGPGMYKVFNKIQKTERRSK